MQMCFITARRPRKGRRQSDKQTNYNMTVEL
jgi:hypothetical protein